MYSRPVDGPWIDVAGERRLAKRTEKVAQLRERRLARKLTQAAFAKELGVTGNTIARWERCEGPVPHWAVPYLDMQEKIAELTSALAEKDARLRGAIEAQNFELQVEKAMRESLRVTPTADQLHRKLCKTFWQDPTTLVTINEVYLSLSNHPPAKPEAMRLLAPQRGLIAIGKRRRARCRIPKWEHFNPAEGVIQ
jgi:transcriptional regulator with XRE-family HTH domain